MDDFRDVTRGKDAFLRGRERDIQPGGVPVNSYASVQATAGIQPARGGALSILQFTDRGARGTAEELQRQEETVREAAHEVASYHAPTGDQAGRHAALTVALANFLAEIVRVCPSGPERSTAISRAREGKFWASAAIALEGR